ncbi:MAG TPA: phosphopentomutase [Candidatus Blautia merdavium]|uniref:Phosphopentomutase n=1 Tax=Candidatus Blautia merdavium TaxID=2838494 RepID=A0A9D2TAG1_9FIRM|nr:phosphopentomutase [Candidatus Blautia merdavium]
MKRVFLFVLDSCGAGAMPDSEAFGDVGVNTLRSCAASQKLQIPNLISYGLGNIQGLEFLGTVKEPAGAYGKLAELSMGKDTIIGHWEIAGIISPEPMPTYPNGFPDEVLEPFKKATGREILANAPWSGTEVIQKYGDEHVKTGALIVYTSADSVFQVAAHEEVVPLEKLYEYCAAARKLLKGKHGVGRVIARPFTGRSGAYKRTPNRHDYSLEPPEKTVLDAVKEAGMDSIAVGKIHDIFAGKGITEHVYNTSNANGMEHAMHYAESEFTGLCFINLVDFDMLYGHRRDPDGYALALNEFDQFLPKFMEQLHEDDVVIITADHGCDPAYTATTDHTREYVPLLILGEKVKPKDLGVLNGFHNIAATVAELLQVDYETSGRSLAGEIL